MARYDRMKVLNTLLDQRMVLLFYHHAADTRKKIIKACHEVGARILVFTNWGDFAHEVFGELKKFADQDLRGMVLGVGSVHDAPTAALYMQLGADFIVGPSYREDVARVCNRRKVPYMPGCGTLTEIGEAEEMGCEIIKLFPGSVYGPGFVKAIKGPSPWTRTMPTGVVSTDPDKLRGGFDAGVSAVGMGSQMISRDLVEKQDWAGLTKRIRETLDFIGSLR